MTDNSVRVAPMSATTATTRQSRVSPLSAAVPATPPSLAKSSRPETAKAVVAATESLSQFPPLSLADFRRLAKIIHAAKRIVAVTGAGISVSAGIPDFRSEDGLYNLIKNRHPTVVFKGRDLFDASLFRDPVSTSLFYEFMAELKLMSDAACLTKTHLFLKKLEAEGRMLRWYTQNIDCLESRSAPLDDKKEGVKAPAPAAALALELGPDNKTSKVTPRIVKSAPSIQLPQTPTSTAKPFVPRGKTSLKSSTSDATLVQLHGDLNTVRCTLCSTPYAFSPAHTAAFNTGVPPACPHCTTKNSARLNSGKRSTAVGVLRPNVVLYGENHPGGSSIAEVVSKDSRKKVNALIVMGTSLKVDGVKRLVRDLSRSVRASGGIVVLVNRTPLGKEWDCVFDYRVLGDCDDVVMALEAEWARVTGDKKLATSPKLSQTVAPALSILTPAALSDQENVPPPSSKINAPISPSKRSKSVDSSIGTANLPSDAAASETGTSQPKGSPTKKQKLKPASASSANVAVSGALLPPKVSKSSIKSVGDNRAAVSTLFATGMGFSVVKSHLSSSASVTVPMSSKPVAAGHGRAVLRSSARLLAQNTGL